MKIEYIRSSGWEEVKDSALTTIHKKLLPNSKEVSPKWKMAILKSEHSPIRELIIRAKFSNIPRWIADQLVRHNIGFTPYMGTMRPDRNKEMLPRDKQVMTTPTVLKFSANAQAIINISKERLCVGCVSKETRLLWERFIKELSSIEPELAYFCVPSCIYRGGCKEFNSCYLYGRFLDYYLSEHIVDGIDVRYNLYKEYKEKK